MKMPGHIKVDKQSFYDDNPALLEQVVKKFTAWADSVPVGTCATLAEVMNTGGIPSGMPVEVWTDPFDNGGAPGLELVVQYGTLQEVSFGMPLMVKKIA